jgi:transcriptional regulator with XRE-family HTH domain
MTLWSIAHCVIGGVILEEMDGIPRLRPERIREMRRRERVSQRQLAKLIGISQPGLSAIETGETQSVAAYIVAMMAPALHTSIEFLMGLTEDPGPWHGPAPEEQQEMAAYLWMLPEDARVALLHFLQLLQSHYQGSADRSVDTPPPPLG